MKQGLRARSMQLMARGSTRTTAMGLLFATAIAVQVLVSCDEDGGSARVCESGAPRDCEVDGDDCDGEQRCNASGTGFSECACASASADTCEPGSTRECNVSGMTCSGSQACRADGTGYSACACEDSSGSGGSAGSENMGQSGAGGVQGGIGARCEVDADCAGVTAATAQLTCITDTSDAEFGAGSPQGGYCSFPCRTTGDCQAVDPLSICATSLPNGGRCIGVCTLGSGTLKCGADRAQACYPIAVDNPNLGGCLPMCTSDAACGNGRFCDTSDEGGGLCRTAQPPGGGIGAPCTVETEATDCASKICLERLVDGAPGGGFCSANCTLNANNGCGFDAEFNDERDAFCFEGRFDDGQPGDLGFCFELCDVDEDCTQEDWVCELLDDVAAEELGRIGECVPRP